MSMRGDHDDDELEKGEEEGEIFCASRRRVWTRPGTKVT